MCAFIEFMPYTKGDWARGGKRLELQPWQVFITCAVFGWKKGERRRFQFVYLEIPRGNGKTEWSAAIGNYMLVADGEMGAEVYCGATTEKQANIAFTAAKYMARNVPDFRKLGVEVMAQSITIPATNSKFERVIGKPGDGDAPSFALVDEYHEHKTDELVDTFRTGMGKRKNSLMWIITTAGTDTSGPCYAFRSDVVKMLDGTHPDETLFGAIYTLDKGDDWTTEAALKKCNPNYGVSADEEYLKSECEKAANSARKQNTFKTKHCNIWSGAKAAWLNMERWADCAVPDQQFEDFRDELCWMGVDLSQRNDFTTIATLFRDGEHYNLFTRHYLPEATVNETENEHYRAWAKEGYITVIPGNVIDYDQVLEDILEIDKLVRIVAVGYDRRFAHQFAIDLVENGINAIEVPQTYAVITGPMADFEGLVLSGKISHDDNPVTNWMMGNVVVKSLQRGGRQGMMPDKELPRNKIDAASATIDALTMAQTQEIVERAPIPEGLLVNF